MTEFKAPFISYEEIARKANQFLDEYHGSRKVPVPIELIVEDKLGLDIVPLPQLKRSIEVEAFISKDLKSIYVDQETLEYYENRYRFSLAHEVGHIILHSHLFKDLSYKNTTEYKEFIETVDTREYGWFESQAYNFAGLVLVPKEQLHVEFDKGCQLLEYANKKHLQDYPQFSEYISNWIAKKFAVSQIVILKRLKKEGLITDY